MNPSKEKFKPIEMIVPVLFLALVLFLLYQVGRLLLGSKNKDVQILELAKDCDIQVQDCEWTMPNTEGKIFISLDSRPIVVEKNYTLKVKKQNLKMKPLFFDLNSVEMDMGFNRPEFPKSSSEVYELVFRLESCTEKLMNWRGVLVLQDSEDLLGIPIYFQTKQ